MTDLKNEKPEDWLRIIFDKMLDLESKYRNIREQESALLKSGAESGEFSDMEIIKYRLGMENSKLIDERNHIALLISYAGLEAHFKDIQNTLEYRKELSAYNKGCIESNLAIAKATEALVKEVKDVKDAVWKSHLERINAYAVLSRAVEEGVAFGYRRAHKHTDKPDEDALVRDIEQAVMNAISEVFDFDENE